MNNFDKILILYKNYKNIILLKNFKNFSSRLSHKFYDLNYFLI